MISRSIPLSKKIGKLTNPLVFMIKKLTHLSYLLVCIFGLLGLISCTDEKESDPLRQSVQAHQLGIVAIELEPTDDLVSRTNTSRNFQAYGVLADGSRLMTEPDVDGNVSDRVINSMVDWSVSDSSLGIVMQDGAFTSSDIAGVVSVIAEFSGLQDSVEVTISDAELSEVIIQGQTQVDVCRNITFSALGRFSDGREVFLENEDLLWSVVSVEDKEAIGEFKDGSLGELSTYFSGDLQIRVLDIATNLLSEPTDILVTSSITDLSISGNDDDIVNPGESFTLTVYGQYPDGEFDISQNASFLSNNLAIGSFEQNILTISEDANGGDTFEVNISCDELVQQLRLSVLDPI